MMSALHIQVLDVGDATVASVEVVLRDAREVSAYACEIGQRRQV